jgi:GMP synthase (glutamine-hydrolysing)
MLAPNAAAEPAAILVIEHDRTAPVARLGQWLRAAGAELDVRSGAAGDELPPDLTGYAGLVVMGGAPGAFDDDAAPWLPHVRQLLADAVRDEVPTLGVCLGGQLLAGATGGRVRRAETPEYGAQLVAKRTASSSDPLFKALPITPDVLQWHVDEVHQLPPGAVLLASSPVCDVQAFRVGRRAWGLQFHIETTPEIVASWAAEDAAVLSDYDLDAILDRATRAHEDIADVWRPFAATFVAVVRDPSLAGGPRALPMVGGPTATAAPITDPAEIRAALAAEMQASRGTHQH